MADGGASGSAAVRADCADRPAVYAMRTGRAATGIGRAATGTSLDDPGAVFPRFVEAAARFADCPAAGADASR
ncbi:hypothetical protein AB0I22_03190 [Streptomyces sp. NPDC050610]|uniref:hypothetical protein n=1 Tax=Streptomyces sp. NPDC050610 TaxID=3157097 RepID=UPI0034157E08